MVNKRFMYAFVLVALTILFAVPTLAATRLLVEPVDGLNADLDVVVRFETGGPGMSAIEYGLDGEYTATTAQFASLDNKHVHVLTGVEPGKTYSYRIVLSDWTGGAATFDGFSLTTPAFGSPDQIDTVTHDGAVELAWAPTFAAASYVLERADAADGAYEVLGTTEATRYLDVGVNSSETYFYRLTAHDAAGNAAASGEPQGVAVIAQVSEPGSVKGGVVVLRTATSPAIDGTLSGVWDRAIWYPFNQSTAYKEQGAWENDEDYSAEFALLYDDENIYFALRAVDNAVVNPHSGLDIWQGDSVEVWFDWGRNHIESGSQYYQLGLAPLSSNREAVRWVWRNPDPDTVRDAMELASSVTDTGYTVEAKIPAFTHMTGAATDIPTAFNVSVNDIDRPEQSESERNHITWSGTLHTQASTWASLLFE